MRFRFSIPLLTFAAALCVQSIASAHAFLDRADPRVGGIMDKAPSEVRAWFTQELEPAFSKLEVFDANGNQVDSRNAHLDGNDKKLLVVSVGKLSTGTYKVKWNVVSVDTHRTQGSFNFEVKG